MQHLLITMVGIPPIDDAIRREKQKRDWTNFSRRDQNGNAFLYVKTFKDQMLSQLHSVTFLHQEKIISMHLKYSTPKSGNISDQYYKFFTIIKTKPKKKI